MSESTEVIVPKTYSFEEKKRAVQSSLFYLIKKNPFLGGLIQELTIRYDNRLPALAGITYNRKTRLFDIILHETFCDLPLEQQMAIMLHEILHFLHQHLFRLPFLSKDTTQEERMLFNIAGDMAINQLINNLPPNTIDVANYKLDDGKPFPTLRTMEEYYELLKNNQKNNKKFLPQPGEGEGEGYPGMIDKHEWDALTDEEKEEFLAESKKIIKRAIEKTQFESSSIPDYVKDILQDLETQLVGINYKKILKDAIVKNASSSDRESTWNRPNRRYGVYAKGTRNGRQPRLAFFNDSSGSISVTEQNEYLRIMDQFLSAGERSCTLGFWHTNLYFNKPYKRGNQIPSDELQSGGTDVTCVLEYIKKTSPDLSIILTDGYFDTAAVKPTSEVIWIISKGGNQDHPMRHVGKTIMLDKLVNK